MKKVLLSAVCAIAIVSCSAGGSTSQSSNSTIGKVAQIATTVSQITSILGANTNLNSSQTSSLTSSLTKYITNYNSITSLEKTDNSKYNTLLSGFKDQALNSVKETVNENQYAQILSNLKNYKTQNTNNTSNDTNNIVSKILSSLAK